jgi:hypothetical protein
MGGVEGPHIVNFPLIDTVTVNETNLLGEFVQVLGEGGPVTVESAAKAITTLQLVSTQLRPKKTRSVIKIACDRCIIFSKSIIQLLAQAVHPVMVKAHEATISTAMTNRIGRWVLHILLQTREWTEA